MLNNAKSSNQTEATEVKTAVMERKSVFFYGKKVSVLTRGGPTDRESGSNNERREVSRGHSTQESIEEGPNQQGVKITGTEWEQG